MLRKLLKAIAVALPLVAATLTTHAAAGDEPDQVPAEVTVVRDGTRWVADYVFKHDAAVWAFRRSALTAEGRTPWRPAQWTVATPGVVLERQGHVDVLSAVDGGVLPRRVTIAMTPAAADLEADYDPALIFTDGSVALFTGQFDVFPLASLDEARALPHDLEGAGEGIGHVRVTWRDGGRPVLFEGERRMDPVSTGRGTYVLFGDAVLADAPNLATVMDPALPSWITTEIGDFAPTVAAYYERRLGKGETSKPTVMASWNGPTPGKRSMGGSVLPGLISMSFEGDRVLERSRDMSDDARWFIGHESAHFWLGQTVRYEMARDAWITEGGADLMAVRAISSLDADYDAKAMLQLEVDDCVRLAVRPIVSANERGEHRANYACGAVFAMAAEGALHRMTGGDWFDALKPMIDASREDGVLTREEWLSALSDPALRPDIERLLDAGSEDSAEVIARLFERSGVAYRLEGGRVTLL